MMTSDSILSLLCKLNDTIDAQQRQIEQLQDELRQLQADNGEAHEWPTDTST